jgi:SAM-dependent methyltransferase
MSKAGRIACVLLVSMIVTAIAGAMLSAQAKPPLHLAIKRQQSRNEYIQFEAVIEALDITEGMTILDIGAGPGYASFLFAEKLHGSGKVIATDIRDDFVGHIADEAKRRGLTNLFSHVVKEEGLDDFYGQHRYDLVFLSNVYHCIDKRIEYFSKLRGLLKPNARLVLVLYNQAPLFSVDDLSDVDNVVDSLSRDAGDNPFYSHLSSGTRELLKDNTGKEGLERALVDDFNRMLVDPGFYKHFYGNSYFRKGLFDAAERDLANWLLMTLQEDGALEKPADRIDAKAMRTVIKLNRMFFITRFGDYLAEGGTGAYVPAGDANRHTSKFAMLRELDAAGYKPMHELRLSPFFDAVIMVPKTP